MTADTLPPSGADRRATRDKICLLPDLAHIAEKARAAGRKVVLAHGVFDLLHLGHVRHLEEARQHGDMLIVTITADRHVNKGPGRPVFTQSLRAQMLAALEQVDWVAVNEEPTAEPILAMLRPDVYVKGSDYANAAEDVTGGIVRERKAVESHGGRLVFTDDITFSSSSLINRYLGVYNPELNSYLADMRQNQTLPQILDMIERVRDFRVLLVGDTIVDDYQYVEGMAKSPKENILVTRFCERELFAGGIIAAANHVAGLCRSVDVVTCIGDLESHEDLIRSSVKPNVRLDLLTRRGKPTTRKTRFVERGYMRKMFEVYNMDDTPVAGQEENWLAERIAAAGDYDLVIVTDFGHGMITPRLIDLLSRHARFLAVNAQTNSGNLGYNLIVRYPRADYVCIDAPEARLAVMDRFSDIMHIASELLPSRIDCSRLIITHGKHGCVTFDKAEGLHRIPAFTSTVIDTMGAGDAFLSVTAPLVAAGGPMPLIGFIGNAAGAMKVNIIGHRSAIEKPALLKFVTALLK
ncbi:rfaE bifunctional protein nucleotidyltransferase chain/domain [Azospirillum lipoferum]|uniref:Adenylyltransferase/cytidyltransferase family protein n=1 Tax=Azospirillum lipoferum TaxID=193 RepID=A0A5A9GHD4_AZOLI|nr:MULTISPECIES: PfkB family carbohydrate kinase [Azospirillum]KAA0593746.1 adenylyltransferase/cytidyltransferase family protein [Azospirillum lipoferum]MCP1614207.1 rfaE bifunctional protein nucleotidyltransferase chain/domain [Azospirillum lipoferum]MDW5536892.1 PfkB family carbohydrate kinase [Azospirillum sp. NL1]